MNSWRDSVRNIDIAHGKVNVTERNLCFWRITEAYLKEDEKDDNSKDSKGST